MAMLISRATMPVVVPVMYVLEVIARKQAVPPRSRPFPIRLRGLWINHDQKKPLKLLLLRVIRVVGSESDAIGAPAIGPKSSSNNLRTPKD